VQIDDDGTIGVRLRRLRRARAMSQKQLAEAAGLSADIVKKLEQGRRTSARTLTLIALANALDVDLSDLVGKRPRLDRGEDVRVLALRDLLLTPELLPDVDLDVYREPPPLDHLERAVTAAWDDYWAGRFTRLTARLPELVTDARAAHHLHGAPAGALLGRAYQLVASLLIHFGRDDLAALAAERGIQVAGRSDDELQWATLHGTYSWTLLHQGRTDAAERHALWVAEQVEPRMIGATLPHLTVWGGLVLWAMAAAVAGGRKDPAVEYIGLARSAAGRFEHGDRLDYQLNFGPSQVQMQATHAYAVLREPGKALTAAGGVRREDLRAISWGRHLIDVAQAHVDGRDLRAAERTLTEAEGMSPEWFRHQGPARSLVSDLVQESRRLSPNLRRLAASAGVN
jgi:transcriptional regulator with XRE-family HTH domain